MRTCSVSGTVIICHKLSHLSLSSLHKKYTIPMIALQMVKARHNLISHKSSHLVSIKTVI